MTRHLARTLFWTLAALAFLLGPYLAATLLGIPT